MSRGVARALSLTFVGACHSTSSIELPDLSSPAGILFFDASGIAPIYAFSRDERLESPFQSSSAKDGLPAFVLELPCSLDVSGLTSGPIELLDTPTAEVWIHPKTKLALDEGGAAWVPAEISDSDELLSARLPADPRARCRETAHELEIEPLGRVDAFSAFASAVSPGRVVVGTSDQRRTSWQVGWVGKTEPELQPIDASNGPWAAAAGRGDEVWLARKDGALAHGRLGETFEFVDVRTSTSSKFTLGLVASKEPADFELFAVTDAGTVERFDGTEWSVVYAIEPDLELLRDQSFAEGMTPGIAWLGPSDVMAIVPGPELTSQIVRAGNGRPQIVAFPGRPYGVATIEGRGTFASGSSRDKGLVVARWEADTWVPIDGLGRDELNDRSARLLAFDQFHALGPTGMLLGRLALFGPSYVLYEPELGYCPAEVALTPFIQAVTPLDDRTFISMYKLESFGLRMEISRISAKFRGPCGESTAE